MDAGNTISVYWQRCIHRRKCPSTRPGMPITNASLRYTHLTAKRLPRWILTGTGETFILRILTFLNWKGSKKIMLPVTSESLVIYVKESVIINFFIQTGELVKPRIQQSWDFFIHPEIFLHYKHEGSLIGVQLFVILQSSRSLTVPMRMLYFLLPAILGPKPWLSVHLGLAESVKRMGLSTFGA